MKTRNFGKKTRFKRCLSVFVCLCMVSTLLSGLPFSGMKASADQLTQPMHILMRHWHADQVDKDGNAKADTIDYYLTVSGLYSANDTSSLIANKDGTELKNGITFGIDTDGVAYITISTKTAIADKTAERAKEEADETTTEEETVEEPGEGTPAPYERFSGYAISAGQEAVTAVNDDTKDEYNDTIRNAIIKIKYNSNVNLVKGHMFYQDAAAAVIGEELRGNYGIPDDDYGTDVYYDENLKEFIYSTDKGLHTNKTVEAVDGRTFDLTLEAWNASEKTAAVGLVLDASGSMAFISDGSFVNGKKSLDVIKFDSDDINKKEKPTFTIPTWDGKGTVTINAYEYITQDDLDKILDPHKTDNSKLGYADYKYYVYNKRSDTQEFTPLAYWSGQSDYVDTTPAGAVGHYDFNTKDTSIKYNGRLLNKAASDGAKGDIIFYDCDMESKDKTPYYRDVKVTNSYPTNTGDFKSLNLTRQSASPKNAYATNSTGVAYGYIKLDSVVSDSDFAFSFAMRTASSLNAEVELFEIGEYKIVHNKNNGLFISDGAGKVLCETVNAINFNDWAYVTVSVNNGSASIYVDGVKVAVNSEADSNINVSDGTIYIGRNFNDATSVEIDIDEIYVYDRALSSTEAADLYTAINADGVTGAYTPDGKDLIGLVGQANDSIIKATNTNYNNYDFYEANSANVRGWYYINSLTAWDKMLSLPGVEAAKGFEPIMTKEVVDTNIYLKDLPEWIVENIFKDNDEAIRAGNQQTTLNEVEATSIDNTKFIYVSNTSFTGSGYYYDGNPTDSILDTDENVTDRYQGNKVVDDKNVAITFPNGSATGTTQGNSKAVPTIFYIDSQGYLRCVFNTGSNSENASRTNTIVSFVYEKDDEARIKTGDLQYALGAFVTALDSESPETKIAAARYSTQNVPNYNDTDYAGNDQLVILDWTDDPVEATKMLSNDRGQAEGYSASYLDHELSENNIKQYNYGLTGGTYTKSGLATYKNKLDSTLENDKAKKYLIIFTDGKDNNVQDYSKYKPAAEGGTEPNDKKLEDAKKEIAATTGIATSLKDEGYTIFCVMLAGGANQFDGDVQNFLVGLAGKSDTALEAEIKENDESYDSLDDDKKEEYKKNYIAENYVFATYSGEALTDIFTDRIVESIKPHLEGYTVDDYLDPRFNLVTASNQTLILGEDGKVTMAAEGYGFAADGKVYSIEKGAAKTFVTLDENNYILVETELDKPSQLHYDSTKKMYFLRWDDQNINGCSVGATKLSVWKASARLVAKDDFLGGNAVLTNGNGAGENMVYHKNDDPENRSSGTDKSVPGENDDDYVSKGFPRTAVDVDVLPVEMEPGFDQIYLGEKIEPDDIREILGGTIQNSDLYWEYIERYFANGKTVEVKEDGKTVEIETKEAAYKHLIKYGELELDYMYLPDKSDDPKDTVTNQAGSAEHQADVMGKLIYKWKMETKPDQTNAKSGDDFYTVSTDAVTYTLTVDYQRTDVGKAGNPEAEEPAEKDSSGRVAANEALVTEKDDETGAHIYGWDSTNAEDYNRFDSKLKDDPFFDKVNGTRGISDCHVTSIIEGEILLRMSVTKEQYEYLYKYYKGEKISYTADLYRTYTDGTEADKKKTKVGTYTTVLGLDQSYDKLAAAIAEGNVNDIAIGENGEILVYARVDLTDALKAFKDLLPIGEYTLEATTNTSVPGDIFSFTKIANVEITGALKDIFETYEYTDPTEYEAGAETLEDADGVKHVLGTQKYTEEDAYLKDRLGVDEIKLEDDFKTITVTKNVVDKITGTNDDSFTFEFKMEINGKDSDESYKYTIVSADGKTTVKSGEIKNGETFTLKDGQSITIEGIRKGGKYTVTETNLGDGYESNKTNDTVTGDVNENIAITFENTYNADGTVNIPVKKILTGRDWITDDSFEFVIKPADADTAAAIANGAISGEKWSYNAETGYFIKKTVNSKTENYTADMLDGVKFNKLTSEGKEYNFVITETKGSAEGMIYDEAKINVKISVSENATKDGKLNVVIESPTPAAVAFTNKTFATWEPEIKKTLEGRTWSELDEFSFELTYIGEKADMVENGDQTIKVKNSDKKVQTVSKKFDEVTFYEEGEYTFQIKETSTSTDTDTFALKCDSAVYSVVVTVKADEKGKLVATPKITKNGASANEVGFVNKASVKWNFDISKKLEGKDWTGDVFTFNVKLISGAADDVEIPDDGKLQITSSTAKESELVSEKFGDIVFKDPGVYKFEVTEDNTGAFGIDYDETVYTIVVEVSDADGKLVVGTPVITADEESAENIVFTNTYLADGKLPISISKTLTGRPWTADDKFEFELTFNADPETGLDMTELKTTAEVKGSANGGTDAITADFGTARFTESGKYEFTITEKNAGKTEDGITYDDKTYTIVVTATDEYDDDELELDVKVTVKENGVSKDVNVENGIILTFENTYTKSESSSESSTSESGSGESSASESSSGESSASESGSGESSASESSSGESSASESSSGESSASESSSGESSASESSSGESSTSESGSGDSGSSNTPDTSGSNSGGDQNTPTDSSKNPNLDSSSNGGSTEPDSSDKPEDASSLPGTTSGTESEGTSSLPGSTSESKPESTSSLPEGSSGSEPENGSSSLPESTSGPESGSSSSGTPGSSGGSGSGSSSSGTSSSTTSNPNASNPNTGSASMGLVSAAILAMIAVVSVKRREGNDK